MYIPLYLLIILLILAPTTNVAVNAPLKPKLVVALVQSDKVRLQNNEWFQK